jgi:tetratricopeptide (TPR) repeat protein
VQAEAAVARGEMTAAMSIVADGLHQYPDAASLLAERGSLLATRREFDAAFVDVERALAKDATLLLALNVRAKIHLMRLEWAGAYDDANAILRVDATSAQGWATRGCACQGVKGDPDEVVACLTRAIELAPDEAAHRLFRSLAREKSGDVAGALEDLRIGDQQWSDFLQGDSRRRYDELRSRKLVTDEQGSLDLGQRAADEGDADGDLAAVAKLAEEAIALNPTNAGAWFVMASTAAKREQPWRAIVSATRSVELEPRMSMAWAVRAVARHVIGDLPGALADAEEGVRQSSSNPMATDYCRSKLEEIRAAMPAKR